MQSCHSRGNLGCERMKRLEDPRNPNSGIKKTIAVNTGLIGIVEGASGFRGPSFFRKLDISAPWRWLRVHGRRLGSP